MTQVDLPRNQRSGLVTAVRILQNIEGIAHIELDEEDVVRHRLVKQILRAYTKEHEKENPQEAAAHRSLGIIKKAPDKVKE
jgi:phosphate starvation-inducible PhoH-like protein